MTTNDHRRAWLMAFCTAGDTELSCRYCGAIPEPLDDAAGGIVHRAECPVLNRMESQE